MLFSLGQVVVTCGVNERMKVDPVFAFYVRKSLQMHSTGNWGDVCDEDWESNQKALKGGDRLLSVYNMDEDGEEQIWIITEWDRSVTTILFPNEY